MITKILNKDIKGCAVLMRYTLRLLTTQQFQRAASLICACEKIRSENEEKLGKIEIRNILKSMKGKKVCFKNLQKKIIKP